MNSFVNNAEKVKKEKKKKRKKQLKARFEIFRTLKHLPYSEQTTHSCAAERFK